MEGTISHVEKTRTHSVITICMHDPTSGFVIPHDPGDCGLEDCIPIEIKVLTKIARMIEDLFGT